MENLKMPFDGEIVYYTLGNEWIHSGEVRPAVIVRVWSESTVNLLVFLDGDNDKWMGPDGWTTVPGYILWKTSVVYDESELTARWHRAYPVLEVQDAT